MTILKRGQKIETRYVTITEDEYESLHRTIETLRDRESMESIKRGMAEMRKGKGTEHEAFVKKDIGKN